MNLNFHPPFNGSWGAGQPNSVSSELYHSYRANLEDAHRLCKTDISPPSADTKVKNFTGTNFKSAFSKFSKRTASDRSPGGDRRSHRSGQAPVTARPPAGYQSKPLLVRKTENESSDTLAGRLASLKDSVKNLGKAGDCSDEDDDEEDGDIDLEES